MINIPIVDIMTLITGEVEKPAAPVADDDMADASFLSFIAEEETGFEQLIDGPDMVPDSGVGRSDNNVDTPVAKVMLLSSMMDQQVAFMPADRSLILSDAESALNVSPEKMTDAVPLGLLLGPLKISEKTSVGAPVLQDTDVAQDMPRQMQEAASVLPPLVASDKQTNAAIPVAISNDAPKQVQQPTILAIPQIGGAFQHNVMPEIAARPRLQIPVTTDPDAVPSSSANTAMKMAPEMTQKAFLGVPMANGVTSGNYLRHAPAEATETKENHRGQPLPILQAPKDAQISNAIVPPKVLAVVTPPNQQLAAVPFANAGLEPNVSQIVPVSIQAPLALSLPNADLPASISRPTAEFPAPQSVNEARKLAPDSAQLQKAQNPLPQHTPNPPTSNMPNWVDPPQIQATTAAPLQTNHSTLPSVAHPFAPLQPAVAVPQSPKRQMSEGRLPQPDVQPVKQTPVQTTTPAPLTTMAEPAVAEASLNPELIPLETRTVDSTTIARHDTITHRPEVARHIAQQLAEAARQMPDRPVELTLNPDELGRVRLTFTMSDGGIHVAVIAERGETMDLLRRHIETLAQEFRNMGYKDVNFDFSRNGQGNSGNTDSNPDDPDTQTPTETQTLAPVQLSLEPSTGLDLRL